MRILSIIHYPVFGGPHNHNLRLAPVLAAHGIESLVLLPEEAGNAGERFRSVGITVLQMPLHRLRRKLSPLTQGAYILSFGGEVAAIRRVVRQHAIDLVQVFGLANPQGAVAGHLQNLPVVWVIGSIPPMILRRLFMPVVSRLADAAAFTGLTVAKAHPGALDMKERLHIYLPPVDTALFKPDCAVRAAAREKLGIPGDDLVVGTVGNINPDKDHATFIRAAAMLRQRYSTVRFMILGAASQAHEAYSNGLWRLAADLGMQLGRDLIVWNPEADVPYYAQALDIFWLTSVAEGIPTAVEEAMSLAIPVVTTDVGSVREVVENEMTGYVVPRLNPEALARSTIPLVNSPDLRARLGKESRRHAIERFDVSICGKTFLGAFHAAVANRRARTSASRSGDASNHAITDSNS